MPRKKAEPKKTTGKKHDPKFAKAWEATAWLGIPWEYAIGMQGDELDFLSERATEAKLDHLKNRKAEEDRRRDFENEVKERQEQQMAAMMQQQQQQQRPPQGYPPTPANYPYGLPNQMPAQQQQMMPQNPAGPPPPV